jgi:anti-sigma factor RsiW
MKCWSEGELRAFIDRELPADQMAQITAHLEGCSVCGDHWSEMAGRASRVSALLSELTEMEPLIRPGRLPRRASSSWRWGGVAAALAAGLLIGIAVWPKRGTEIAVTPPAPAPVVQSALTRPATPDPVVTLAGGSPKKLAPAARRPRRPAGPKPQVNDTFLALDNDPIEAGVVLRVALGPREVPADVIIDADGRPRAIRLVNFKSNH